MLPLGPLVFNVTTAEQYSKSNAIDHPLNTGARSGSGGNWGLLQVTSIVQGTALAPPGSDIVGASPVLFSDAVNGGPQILGAFRALHNNPGTPDTSRGGVLDLFYWASGQQSTAAELGSAANLLKRSADGSQYSGFTCAADTAQCSFLVRLLFSPGADAGSQVNTVFSPAGSFDFSAYFSVDRSRIGPWSGPLDSDFFTLNPLGQACGAPQVSCPAANDLRASGRFTQTGASAWDVAGTDIFGLGKAGTLRGAVAEPASPWLVALALAALWPGRQHRATQPPDRAAISPRGPGPACGSGDRKR